MAKGLATLLLLASPTVFACCLDPCSGIGWAEAAEAKFEAAEFVLLVKVGVVTRVSSDLAEYESTIRAKASVVEVFKGRVAPHALLPMELHQPDLAFAWQGDLLVVYLNELQLANRDFAKHSCETHALIVADNDPLLATLRRLALSRDES